MEGTALKSPSLSDTGQVESDGDAETFTGKIVYNPDGSAYIIEGGSDGSDVESEVGSILKEGSIVDARPPEASSSSSSAVGPTPQVVSAHHICRGPSAALQGIYSALCGSQLLHEKVPEVPIMHSYRVFTLRDKESSRCRSPSDPSAGDANNNDGGSDDLKSTLTVPVKPILMCFICKISFGYAKSFVSHATSEHKLVLNEDEERLLGQKNSSAIIQGVGKDKEPLLSFLEPKNKAPQPLIPPSLAGLAANMNQLQNAASSQQQPQAGSSQSSLHQQFQQQLMAMATAQAAALAAMRHGQQSSLSSSSNNNASLFNSLTAGASDANSPKDSRPSSNGSLNLILPKNCDDDKNGDQDCSELADLANLEKIAKAAAAAIQQQQEMDMSVFGGSPSSQSPNAGLLSTSPKPGHPNLSSMPGCSQPDGKGIMMSTIVSDLFPVNVRLLIDTGGHMTMMHSRNSCKTLKCPKCNWHYKYQETLEIHMKEKHPENEMNCIYCLTNQPHPRLARGETYTCGYKPYRCEVCNYSTTTKGNLSIHMQSDKHINNVQELQNGNMTPEHILQSSLAAAAAVAAASAARKPTTGLPGSGASGTTGGSNASSPGIPIQIQEKASPIPVPGGPAPPPTPPVVGTPQQKPKATWRCDVCNYETNVARNLRIHMTSEKHTHNMMVLQQNVKHMQQLSALQQAGLLGAGDPLFGQFHPGIFAALAGAAPSPSLPSPENPLQPEAALADMAYNHALLMMASQHQQQRAMAAMMQHPPESPQGPQSKGPGNSCPYCTFTCSSDMKMNLHVLTQHTKELQQQPPQQSPTHASGLQSPRNLQQQRHHHQSHQHHHHHEQPQAQKEIIRKNRILCPLCQEGHNDRAHLESHLVDVHNVKPEGVQKLLTIVDKSGDLIVASPGKKSANKFSLEESDELHASDGLDGRSDCSSGFREDQMNLAEANSFLRMSGGIPAAVSDRHIYKYRCQQCSLAFKTKEKLQLHSQYHRIRAATQCILCNRSFRSVESLQKHVETSHQDMTEGEVECYRQSLANNPLLAGGRNGAGILDPATTELLKKESNRMETDGPEDDMDFSTHDPDEGDEEKVTGSGPQCDEGGSLEDYLNSQTVAENSYEDPMRKFKCHRCKVAFTRQSYLTSHNKTLLHRKGEKMSYPMEKYLDPNRPFKCDICKESFTQKNILLVHYNSVSHLHKLKMAMKESSGNISDTKELPPPTHNDTTASSNSTSTGDNSDKKPFRCNICKLSFNLASTLDIHVRSVLHQTRASKLHELAISGQIDLTLPLIERPDSEPPAPAKPEMKSPSGNQTHSDQMASITEQQIQQQIQQQAMALNLAAMAQSLGQSPVTPSGTNQMFPCGNCGAVFTSQDTSLQHQQICCIFNGNQFMKSVGAPSMASTSKSENFDSVNRGPQQSTPMRPSDSKVMFPVMSTRSKPPLYKHLLETWGFEIVMQFNEHHQRKRKSREVDEEKGAADECSQSVQQLSKSETNRKNEPIGQNDNSAFEEKESTDVEMQPLEEKSVRMNLPEINRSKCHLCQKEFTSIWVLKVS